MDQVNVLFIKCPHFPHVICIGSETEEIFRERVEAAPLKDKVKKYLLADAKNLVEHYSKITRHNLTHMYSFIFDHTDSESSSYSLYFIHTFLRKVTDFF